MRPKGTSIQLEVRRRVAISLLETGWGVRQGARHVKASPSSVRRWRDAVARHAQAGLDAKPHPGGSQPKLTLEQRQHLIDLLRQGARVHGFRNELWTLWRIATVIARHFGHTYCPSGVWHLMRRLGWSPQKPARRARERDEQAIAQWPSEDWPRIKKARREGRTIVFIDQSGFMLQPTVRCTWAPQGHTPIQHSWDRHDRLSVTGAITVSPMQKRLGLYFSVVPWNVTGDEVFTFVQQLRSHLKRPLLLIWDRFSGHKKAARLLRNIYGHRIHVEFLPAYAPELNVVDHAWGHTKYGEMANFIPHNVDDLAREVAHSLITKHHRRDLLHAFFQHAHLEL